MVALIIFLAVLLLSVGPVALIMAVVLFNKLELLQRRLNQLESKGVKAPAKPQPPLTVPQAAAETPIDISAAEPAPIPPVQPKEPAVESSQVPPIPAYVAPASPKTGLEQKIGITVALIVGVITVIIGVGFFLKYVYDQKLFSDVARVCLVAGCGVVSLIVGEVIRRRDYGIVAKGLAALGFALFYAAVFSAARVYNLIDLNLALLLSLGITVGAMAYAVSLNERLIAFLSLLGGYLSPLVIMYDRDMPVPVFSYILAISMGAMGCAALRRWRTVNWITLIGTWLLYTVWFEQSYTPSRMTEPLVWMSVFGGLYLLQPLAYGLLRKAQSRAEDVGLIVLNSVLVFYYLCRVLSSGDQHELSLAVAAFGAIHLLLMAAVMLRCRDDQKLTASLGVLGTALVTTAVGLYFTEMRPMLLSWSIEAVVLTYIGIRFKSLWPKAMGFIVAATASAGLLYHLPLHGAGAFKLILNAPFGTWLFVCAAIAACHVLWRWMGQSDDPERAFSQQAFYIWAMLLLAAGCVMEWVAWCGHAIVPADREQTFILCGFLLVASVLVAMLFERPICPKGQAVQMLGFIAAIVGTFYTAAAMSEVYYDSFTIFANGPFALALLYVLTLLAAAWRIRQSADETKNAVSHATVLVLLAMGLFWILLSEQIYLYYNCRNQYAAPIENGRFTAQMVMSLSWAIYAAVLLIIGFFRRAAGVRYLSLVIFTVLLGKINWDIQELKLPTEYRIATFVTTGLILVGVSFLYQTLKKKGFFDAIQDKKTEQLQNNPVIPVNPV